MRAGAGVDNIAVAVRPPYCFGWGCTVELVDFCLRCCVKVGSWWPTHKMPMPLPLRSALDKNLNGCARGDVE